MFKKIISVFVAAALAAGAVSAVSAETKNETAVNADDITLYALDSEYEDVLSIPEEYPTEFQLVVDAKKELIVRLPGKGSIDISLDLVISPVGTKWYWVGNTGTTKPIENAEKVTTEYSYGDYVLNITADGTDYDINVHVKSYAELVAERMMDEFLADKNAEELSDYEKLDLACRYAASFDYSTDAVSSTGMVLLGRGECHASAELIVRLCEKMDVKAWVRDGSHDEGAFEGHVNVMAEADGELYIADAGYDGKGPRYYSIVKVNGLLRYEELDDGSISIIQYDGNDTLNVLEIPSEIDGKKVSEIAEETFAGFSELKAVIIPEGVRKLGAGAFRGCSSLRLISLPSTLTEICDGALDEIYTLEHIFASYSSGIKVGEGNDALRYIGTTVHDSSEMLKIERTEPTFESDGKIGFYCTECGGEALVTVTVPKKTAKTIRGDANGNGVFEHMDIIYVLNYVLFGDSFYPARQNMDYNGDRAVDTKDVIYLLNHLLFPQYYKL